jgi:hypothetical protein
MATWRELERDAPALAEAGRALFYQFGVGLGYLATVRPDGGPRLHPFCPILHQGGLYGLIAHSPKRGDLLRDGRYAIHTFPSPDRDDEFYVTGRASLRAEAGLAEAVRRTMTAAGATSSGDETLFEFDVERALLATYEKRGAPDNWPPRYTKWLDPRRRPGGA